MAPRPRFLDTCRAIFVLSLASASTAYAGMLAGARHLENFDARNASSPGGRSRLLATLAIGAGVGLVASSLYWLWRRDRGALRLVRASRISMPFVLAGLLFPILRSNEAMEALPRTAAMAVFVICLEQALRIAFAEAEGLIWVPLVRVGRVLGRALGWLERKSAYGVGLLVLGYALYMSWFTILNHRHFGTSSFDLGGYDCAFYNTLHGHPFRSPPSIPDAGNGAILRTHAEFALYTLLPLYALYPNAQTLLVLQSWALASGAVPVYRMASRRVSRGAGFVLALAYLLYAPLHGANFYDVHFQTFGAAAALWAIGELDARHTKRFLLFFVLALASREDIPLLFVCVGLYMLATGCRPGAGLAITVVSTLYFLVLKFVVMPAFGTWWFSDMYKDLYPPGDPSYSGVLKTVVLNPVYTWQTLLKPEKVVFALQILTPLAFLPLRKKYLWLCLVPGAFLTVLTTGYPATISIRFQYPCYFIALMFPAAALALEALRDKSPSGERAALLAVLAGTLFTTTAWGAIPPRAGGFQTGYRTADMHPVTEAERTKEADLLALDAMVPRDAWLAVTEQELPHVSARLNCLTLKNGLGQAEYILSADGAFTSETADAAERSGRYAVIARRGVVKLLKRK
jgi:uncharacterized membrane protein